MTRAEPKRALEGKFTFQHCAAAALVDGAGHDAQFTAQKVNDPVIARLRACVSATVDPAMREDETRLAIVLSDGRRVETHVMHATGSPENPMPDDYLIGKFRALAREALPEDAVERLLAAVWDLDRAPTLAPLCRLLATEA
jgi:2-methylcitrate dehydratase PrpD